MTVERALPSVMKSMWSRMTVQDCKGCCIVTAWMSLDTTPLVPLMLPKSARPEAEIMTLRSSFALLPFPVIAEDEIIRLFKKYLCNISKKE